MSPIQRGFRCTLENHANIGAEFAVDINVTGPATYDSSCFGIDANNKLSDDRCMVFYNQASSPSHEIVLSQTSRGVSSASIFKLSALIDRLVFTAGIDGISPVGQPK